MDEIVTQIMFINIGFSSFEMIFILLVMLYFFLSVDKIDLHVELKKYASIALILFFKAQSRNYLFCSFYRVFFILLQTNFIKPTWIILSYVIINMWHVSNALMIKTDSDIQENISVSHFQKLQIFILFMSTEVNWNCLMRILSKTWKFITFIFISMQIHYAGKRIWHAITKF